MCLLIACGFLVSSLEKGATEGDKVIDDRVKAHQVRVEHKIITSPLRTTCSRAS